MSHTPSLVTQSEGVPAAAPRAQTAAAVPAAGDQNRTTRASTITPVRPVDDDLGKSVVAARMCLAGSESFAALVRASRHASGLRPDIGGLPHKASALLGHLCTKGTPAPLGTPPWPLCRQREALKRGAHRSAIDHIDFVRKDSADMTRKGHWVVLPAQDVLGEHKLRLSPLGAAPQAGRHPCVICDHSSCDVGLDTTRVAPEESMQFGRALIRLTHRTVHAGPAFGPAHIAKYDLSEGCHRMQLHPGHVLRLATLLPTREGEGPLIATPLVLPMGWNESRPHFCAATETVADLANDALRTGAREGWAGATSPYQTLHSLSLPS